MTVLIVDSDETLGPAWKGQIEVFGIVTILAKTQEEAVDIIRENDLSIIVLNLDFCGGSAMAVADYAAVRRPECGVIFVTNTSVFSDGSIFSHTANAIVMVPPSTSAKDLAAIAGHYCRELPM